MPDHPRLVILGNPGSRRVTIFQRALADLGLPAARVISWADALDDLDALPRALSPDDLLRVESPGEDFEVERRLIALGAGSPDDPGPRGARGRSRISAEAAMALPQDPGLILHPRQWFLGLRAALRRWRPALPCPAMNDLADIEIMFDKRLCAARLAALGVPTPPSLGPVEGWDHLREVMGERGIDRVFVKLASGSSASGVIALSLRRAPMALTSMERAPHPTGLRFYNSLRVRRYSRPEHLAELVDAVCAEGAQVEVWIPKARLDGHMIDLRVVVIGGRACHVVVRQGRSPMTNLHLGGGRGDLDAAKAKITPARWDAMMGVCERAAGAFPDSLYCGVDLLIGQDWSSCFVLEINAFGDLLPGISWRGADPCAVEIQAALGLPLGHQEVS